MPITVCGFILIDCLPLGMAARWLPNTEEFFFSLARLIESSERQLKSASYDNSEFLFRRLDEYERTLATLLARFVESYGSLPSQQNTVSNLCYLRKKKLTDLHDSYNSWRKNFRTGPYFIMHAFLIINICGLLFFETMHIPKCTECIHQ